MKENCKTPSHQRGPPSVNFLPGWYLTKRNESKINNVHVYPRGDPSLATLHQDAPLNTICTDRNLVVTIIDRLDAAKTTEEGTRRTEKLSLRALEKLSAKAADSSEEDDNALTFDSDDADLSFEVEEAKASTSLKVTVYNKAENIQPSAETLTELTQTKKLIREISLTSSEQDHQEALHLSILLAAAKAEGIKAEGSFISPAMLSNTFSATKELSTVAQDLSDCQAQLAYQLDENIATTKDLRITLMQRTLKGAMNSAFKTDNLDKQIQQERKIKALKEKLTASDAKFEEANRLELSHREEVKIMSKEKKKKRIVT